MKKIVALLIVLALVATVAFTGCTTTVGTGTGTDTTETSGIIDATGTDIPNLQNIPADATLNEIMDLYRSVIQERLLLDEDLFLPEEETTFIEAHGFNKQGSYSLGVYDSFSGEVYHYYYPVLFESEDDVVLIYTHEDGDTVINYLTGHNTLGTNYLGNVHAAPTETEEIIQSVANYAILYDQETGRMAIQQWGTTIREYDLPNGAIYTGHSYWCGYIFRAGTDVYAVKEYGSYGSEESYGISLIATGVNQVLQADYQLSSDAWSQPLFLMEDGTVKAYCHFDGGELMSPLYEGGYGR